MRLPPFLLNEDAKLLAGIREGDEGALAALYGRSRKQVLAFVTRNSGSAADAEDMLQDALIVLWERVRAGRFVHEARLTTFLLATVRNMWFRRISRLRKETPRDFTDDPVASSVGTALDALLESERALQVSAALDKLGDPCRKLLLLFYWEELSMDEIARSMGFANAQTVKSKKYQCKKALEKLLKDLR